MTISSPRRFTALVLTALALAALGGAVPVLAQGSAQGSAPGPDGPVLTVSEQGCGEGWSPGPAGPQRIRLSDTGRDPAEVYLIDPVGGAVYGELVRLLPRTSRTMTSTLGAGQYALRCVFTDGQIRTSVTHGVTGSTTGAVPGVPPLPDLQLDGPVNAYRGYVGARLPGLLTDVRTLDADVAAGNLDRARADWLPAHLDYERLGAAYNSFGDFDARIDGTAAGLPLGTADPSWTGFHRIEYGLWHGAADAALRPLTADLIQAVTGLTEDFTSADIDPGGLPLRSHEILENALQFQLSGLSDYGSGTQLATLRANLDGTGAVLTTLAALIAPRDPQLLPAIAVGTAAVRADLDAVPANGAGGQPTRTQRQKLNGDLGALLEQLSTVPGLLQGRTGA